MKIKLSIQIKAALLIIVFGLNTAVGFACAMGIDFKAAPKNETGKAEKIHVHANGKKHHHHNPAQKLPQKNEQHKKDDCCTDKVIKFQNIDKNITQGYKHVFTTPVLVPMLSNLIDNNIYTSPIAPAKYVVRNFHPPPCSILITIQRFQI